MISLQVFVMKKSPLQILLPSVLAAYLFTAAGLLVLAFGLYHFQLAEMQIEFGIRAIYVLSCMAAGIIAGKRGKNRRFLWGLISGFLYFLILTGISFLLHPASGCSAESLRLPLLLCTAGGIAGGIIS